MLDFLNAVERLKDQSSSGWDSTARGALKIVLISVDFPTPDCYRTSVNRTCSRSCIKPYSTHDKDPEPVMHLAKVHRWLADATTLDNLRLSLPQMPQREKPGSGRDPWFGGEVGCEKSVYVY